MTSANRSQVGWFRLARAGRKNTCFSDTVSRRARSEARAGTWLTPTHSSRTRSGIRSVMVCSTARVMNPAMGSRVRAGVRTSTTFQHRSMCSSIFWAAFSPGNSQNCVAASSRGRSLISRRAPLRSCSSLFRRRHTNSVSASQYATYASCQWETATRFNCRLTAHHGRLVSEML